MNHPIIRLMLLTVFVILLCRLPANAQEPPAQKPPEILTAFYRVPPGLFFKPGEVKSLADGVKLIDKSPFHNSSRVYDVSDLLQRGLGVDPVTGSEAYYLANEAILFVRNTQTNLDLLDVYGFGDFVKVRPDPVLRTEIFLIELPHGSRSQVEAAPTYNELRALAGNKWKQTFLLSTISKSGIRATVSTAPSESSPPVGSRDTDSAQQGSTLQLENILGPDHFTIDANFGVRVLYPTEPSGKLRTFSVLSRGRFEHEKPALILYEAGGPESSDYALAMRITLCLPDGRPAKLERPEVLAE